MGAATHQDADILIFHRAEGILTRGDGGILHHLADALTNLPRLHLYGSDALGVRRLLIQQQPLGGTLRLGIILRRTFQLVILTIGDAAKSLVHQLAE